jgi:hypothetical protein
MVDPPSVRRPPTAALAVVLTLLAAAPAAQGAEKIVVLESPDRTPAAETAERERKLGFEADQTYDRVLDGFAADLTPRQVARLEADPEVADVIPVRTFRATAVTEALDGDYVPAGVRRITQLERGQAREQASGAVAVLDTGVDLDHPDLDVEPGENCIARGAPPDDDDPDGHGTHVAGTIGAKNDGTGVVGVAPGTKLYAVKVLDRNGRGTSASLLCGIEWVLRHAAAKNITVANFSLGGHGPYSTCKTDYEHQAFCRLANAGVTPVVAAGNSGADFAAPATRELPAAYREVLTVSAIADTDGRPGGEGPACGVADDTAAPFSNYATKAADENHLVAAPGTCVASTRRGGGAPYAVMSGTSMATPHVAALVALCKGEAGEPGPCAGLTTPQVIARMRVVSAWSSFTGIAGRRFGPLAVISDPRVETPPVVTYPEEEPRATSPAKPAPAPAPRPAPAPAPTPPPAARPAPHPPRPAIPSAPPRAATPDTPGAATAAERRPSIRLKTPRLATLLRRGLTLRIACPDDCSGIVRLTVSQKDARKLKIRGTTLGRARVRREGTVRLKLSQEVRSALRRTRRVQVRLRAEIDLPERTVKSSKTLTLRR